MAPDEHDDSDGLVARSFVARAVLEPGAPGPPSRRWYGFVTDAQSGLRRLWRRPSDVSRFIADRLAEDPATVGLAETGSGPEVAAMSAPSLDDVVGDMLTVLGERLPPPGPVSLPVANVTLETVAERPIGIGNHRGAESAGPLGVRTLRGGRLDARVRFQVWAAGPAEADSAMQSLHSTLLDDVEVLRQVGFLRFAPVGTSLAEHLPTIPAWRKAASYDVLYEFAYADADDAASLIARIPVTGDTEEPDGPAQETQTLTDHLVRWDQEGAPALVVTGPIAVTGIEALAFSPGPVLGGTVRVRRTAGGSPAAVADLDAFLVAAATPGAQVEVGLAPASFLAALGPLSAGPVLGDWDTDGIGDAYLSSARAVSPPLLLTAADRLEITYTPPAGPGPGLDRIAVVYLRVGTS